MVYNLGGPPPVSLVELAELLVSLHKGASYTVRSFPGERRKIDIGDFFADYRRITQDLDWHPAVPLRDALARTLDFYRENLRHYV
jgi:nucleoside-diphosphate-sugar epimerase